MFTIAFTFPYLVCSCLTSPVCPLPLDNTTHMEVFFNFCVGNTKLLLT